MGNDNGNFWTTDMNSDPIGNGNLTKAQWLDPGGMLLGPNGMMKTGSNSISYQAHQAPLDEANYLPGMQNVLSSYGENRNQNQAFIQALQQQMAGNGPSVAQNQLNETTGQNISRAAAMSASQKGVDPALAAKMAVDAGANANQNAAGQAATLRSQEQLGTQGVLGSTLANQDRSDQGWYGTMGQLNNQQNQNRVQNLAQAQGLNAKVATTNQEMANQQKGGLMGGLSSVMGMMGANGGEVNPSDNGYKFGNSDYAGDDFASGMASAPKKEEKKGGGAAGLISLLALLAHGGEANPKLVPGDSYQNDVVPAVLSPGEIVLPRSVTQSPEAAEKAKAFVEAIKKTHKPTEKAEYKHVVEHMKACGGRV